MNRALIDMQIDTLYKQYCQFTNITNIIKFKKNYVDIESPSVRIGNPPIFNINAGYFKVPHNKIRSILYHEFTHVQDYGTLCLNYSMSDRQRILLLYTEIHATVVELKCLAGFENVADNKIIAPDTPIDFVNTKIKTIGDYMDIGNRGLNTYLDAFLQNKTHKNFHELIKEIGYAIGRFIFCGQHLTAPKVDFNGITRVMDVFGTPMEYIISVGRQQDISENDMIYMTNLWEELRGEWAKKISHYILV